MRKFIVLSLFVLLAFCAVAQAASKVGTFGAPNSSGTAPMEVDSDRAITVASDATFVTSTSDINGGTIDGATVGATTPAAGKFTTLQATGTTTAVAVNTTGTVTVGTPTVGGASPAKSVAIEKNLEVDGSVYFDGVIIDTALYAATSGTSLNRTLCVDSAGKIFSSAAACP